MSIFHKKKGQPYHVENSLRGIRAAAKMMRRIRGRLVRRWNEIDLDLNMTADGVIVNTHWAMPLLKDGFIDPQGKIPSHTHVDHLTWAEVSRLHTRDGYRIRTLTRELEECARVGIGARLEPKNDKRFEDPAVWHPVKAECDRLGVKVKGYSIRNLGGPGAGVRRVQAMRAAGIPAVPIH